MVETIQGILTALSNFFNETSTGNLIGAATWMLTAVTLFVAGYSAHIGNKAYNQIEREEPWKLTKVAEEHWVLERNHPMLATLRGEIVYPRHHEKAWEVVQIPVEYCQIGTSPFMHFRRGTKIIVSMPELPVGSLFRLYYRDHVRRFPWSKKLHPLKEGDYTPNITPSAVDLDGNVKTWETPLY